MATSSELVIEVLPKRLYLGENNLPIFRIYGDTIDKVKETISPVFRVIVSVEPIKIKQLKKYLARKFSIPCSLIHRHYVIHRRRIIIEDIHAEVFRIDLYRIKGIYVFHHQVPDRIPCNQTITLKHLQHQTVIGDLVLPCYVGIGSGGDTIVGKLPYLIYIPFVGILVGNGQYFIIVKSLTERYIT